MPNGSDGDPIAGYVLEIVHRLAAIQDRSPDAIARRIGGTANTYRRLQAGKGLRTQTVRRLVARARQVWPEGLPFPAMPDLW